MIRNYDRSALVSINNVVIVPGVIVQHRIPDVKNRDDNGVDVIYRDSGMGVVFAVDADDCHVLWSEIPNVEKDNGFSRFVMPLVRRVYAPLLANKLVSVQPMSPPMGKLFYLDYAYGNVTGSI